MSTVKPWTSTVYRLGFGYLERLLAIPAIKRPAWRLWYELFGTRFDTDALHFLNCGYFDPVAADGPPLPLEEPEEAERLCVQLYHQVVSGVALEGRRVLEVGCGRGGGSWFVRRRLGAGTLVGVDRSRSAVRRARAAYGAGGLHFVAGDAEALPFADAAFDVVVNVESSHCYGSMAGYLADVARVLRPGGHLLFADFRPVAKIAALRSQFGDAGLEIVGTRDITTQVLAALALDSPRRRALVAAYVPTYLATVFGEFCVVQDSTTYRQFQERTVLYQSYVLRRPNAGRSPT